MYVCMFFVCTYIKSGYEWAACYKTANFLTTFQIVMRFFQRVLCLLRLNKIIFAFFSAGALLPIFAEQF